MKDFDIRNVSNTIFESIAHNDKRRISIFENYLLWLAGKFYYPLGKTQDPYRIVSGGEGICSEVSMLFNSIARLNGYEARFVGLNGHVVSEIKTDHGWYVVDPDYGVVYPVGLEVLESEAGIPMMTTMLSERGFSKATIQSYIQFFHSSEDNVIASGAALSPRLYLIERLSDWLKWIVPVLLIVLGGMIRKSHTSA